MSKDKGDVLLRATEQENKLREELNKAGGLGNKILIALDIFFSGYAENPRPDQFPEICRGIHGLRLMCLPEHRNGLAGGIAAVTALHPDLVKGWKEDPIVGLLIDSADRLAPPLVDSEINSIGQVEYLWVWWLVTREEATLTRLLRQSLRQDMVGIMAQDLLVGHTNIRRIHEAVKAQHMLWKPQVRPVVDPELKLLAERLAGDLNVICMGRQGDGKLVAVTLDGSRPDGCPEAVLVRLPTKEEVRMFQALQDEAEEP